MGIMFIRLRWVVALQWLLVVGFSVPVRVGAEDGVSQTKSGRGGAFQVQVEALKRQSAGIESRTKALLARIRGQRRELLDMERLEILEQLQRWRTGQEDMEAADYHQRLEQALAIAEEYGVDIERMRALHELMKKTILRMEFLDPNDTGQGTWNTIAEGVYEYFDWAHGEEQRIAKAQQQRVNFYKKAMQFFIQALLERDPEVALAHFERYLAALRQMQSAEADQLIAEAEMIVATQRLVVDISAGLPLVGDAMDILALATGEDLAGHKLSAAEKGLTAFFVAGIPVLGQVIKRAGPSVKEGVGKLIALFMDATVSQREAMARVLRTSGDEIGALVGRLRQIEGVEQMVQRGRRALNALRLAKQAVVERMGQMRQVIARLRAADTAADEVAESFDDLMREARRHAEDLPAEEAQRLQRQLDELREEFVEEGARVALRRGLRGDLGKLEALMEALGKRSDFDPDLVRGSFEEIAAGMRRQMDQLPADEAAELAQRLERMEGELAERIAAVRELHRAARESFELGLDQLQNSLDQVADGTLSPREFLERIKWTQNQLKGLGPEEAKRLGEQLRGVEGQFRETLERMAREAAENSPDAATLNRAWQAGEQAALEKVNRIQQLIDAGRANLDDPEFLEAYQAIRADKRALTELKNMGEQYTQLRTAIRQFEDRMLEGVDAETIDDIRMVLQGGADEMSRNARRRMEAEIKRRALEAGVPPSALQGKSLEDLIDVRTVDMDTFKATNKPPAPDDLGMDRDVTFQVIINNIAGHNVGQVVVDVSADVAGRAYHGNLYRAMHPGASALPSGSALHEWGAEAMDHVVTDARAADAYRLDMDIKDFFPNPGRLVNESRQIDDFANTVFYKSDEWFERAARHMDEAEGAAGEVAQNLRVRAMAETIEGTRQALKQYDRYMEAILENKQLSSAAAVPAHVRQGMEVFRGLKNRRLSYPQAMEALRRLGVSPTDVVRDFADHFRMVVKLEDPGRALLRGAQ